VLNKKEELPGITSEEMKILKDLEDYKEG